MANLLRHNTMYAIEGKKRHWTAESEMATTKKNHILWCKMERGEETRAYFCRPSHPARAREWRAEEVRNGKKIKCRENVQRAMGWDRLIEDVVGAWWFEQNSGWTIYNKCEWNFLFDIPFDALANFFLRRSFLLYVFFSLRDFESISSPTTQFLVLFSVLFWRFFSSTMLRIIFSSTWLSFNVIWFVVFHLLKLHQKENEINRINLHRIHSNVHANPRIILCDFIFFSSF